MTSRSGALSTDLSRSEGFCSFSIRSTVRGEAALVSPAGPFAADSTPASNPAVRHQPPRIVHRRMGDSFEATGREGEIGERLWLRLRHDQDDPVADDDFAFDLGGEVVQALDQ